MHNEPRRTLKFERKPKSKPIYHNPRDIEIWTYHFLNSYSSNLSIPRWRPMAHRRKKVCLGDSWNGREQEGYISHGRRVFSFHFQTYFHPGWKEVRRSSPKTVLEQVRGRSPRGLYGLATPSSVPLCGNQSQQLVRINLVSRLNHHRMFEVIVPPQTLSFEKREGCGEECRVELSLEGGKWGQRGRGGGCRRLETLVWKNDGHIGRCAVVNQFPLGNSAERNINSRGWTLWIQIAPSDAR